MYQNLTILRMAGAMAQNAALRQSAVARNVANADTPGYKAVDAPGFADTVKQDDGFALRETMSGHMGAIGSDPTGRIAERAHPGSESPDGNTVSIENEMVTAAELRQQNDTALAVYKSALNILRASLGRN